MRMLAMVIGLAGGIIAVIVTVLYAFFHTLGRVAGIAADSSHMFIGLGLSVAAIVGSLFLPVIVDVGEVLLIIAIIGLFFILGWWALIPNAFLLVAAVLAFVDRRRRVAERRAQTVASQG
jgi:hypothetical protein